MIEKLVKNLGRKVGIDITRYRSYGARRAQRLRDGSIATVIDVGAHTGSYAMELRSSGYAGRIISLEPVAATFAQVARKAAADPLWECQNVAIGAGDGDATINVASNLASSSLLAMRDEHRRGAPSVSYTAKERVVMRQLDSLGLDVAAPALLKIDVQGYESNVLAGAKETLSRVALIDCELGIAQLYDDQPSFKTMIDILGNIGFEIVDLDPFFYDRADGRVLAIDAMFVRAE